MCLGFLIHIVWIVGVCYLSILFSLMSSGKAEDHGISDLSTSSLILSSWANSCSRRYLKYSYGFKPFALVVSAILYNIPLVLAPLDEAVICQLCFPTQKLRMLRSASELSSGIIPLDKNSLRYFSWFIAYFRALYVASVTVLSTYSFAQSKKSSTRGFIFSWRYANRSSSGASFLSLSSW